MTSVYIALGSNVGDRATMLRLAVARLASFVDVTVVSPVYETDPVGYQDQQPFFNAVIAGSTELDADALLQALHRIEDELGRERPFPNAPRTIDLDLLFYGGEVIDEQHLTVPHPRLHERLFVLVPLADIAPHLHHPRLGQSICELLRDLGRPARRVYHVDLWDKCGGEPGAGDVPGRCQPEFDMR